MRLIVINIFLTMLFFSHLILAMDVPMEEEQALFPSGEELLEQVRNKFSEINACRGPDNCFFSSLSAFGMLFYNKLVPVETNIPICNNIIVKSEDNTNFAMFLNKTFAQNYSNDFPPEFFIIEEQELSNIEEHKRSFWIKTNNLNNTLKKSTLRWLNNNGSMYEIALICHLHDDYEDNIGYFNIFLTFQDRSQAQKFYLISPQIAWQEGEKFVHTLEEFEDEYGDSLKSEAYIFYDKSPNHEKFKSLFKFLENYPQKQLDPQIALALPHPALPVVAENNLKGCRMEQRVTPAPAKYIQSPSGLPALVNIKQNVEAKKIEKKSPNRKSKQCTEKQAIDEVKSLQKVNAQQTKKRQRHDDNSSEDGQEWTPKKRVKNSENKHKKPAKRKTKTVPKEKKKKSKLSAKEKFIDDLKSIFDDNKIDQERNTIIIESYDNLEVKISKNEASIFYHYGSTAKIKPIKYNFDGAIAALFTIKKHHQSYHQEIERKSI